jgi:hypothetical protein
MRREDTSCLEGFGVCKLLKVVEEMSDMFFNVRWTSCMTLGCYGPMFTVSVSENSPTCTSPSPLAHSEAAYSDPTGARPRLPDGTPALAVPVRQAWASACECGKVIGRFA